MLLYFILSYFTILTIFFNYSELSSSSFLISFFLALGISYYLKKRLGSLENKIPKENKYIDMIIFFSPELILLLIFLFILIFTF